MKCFRFFVSVVFLFSLLLLPMRFVFAVELSSLYVTPTSHVASAAANYEFILTLNGSASWSEGETLTITFPSDYLLSSFTEDDVDIADDGVDLTTATDCSGSEQVGVSFSGLAVTFEMCAGDGGTIASSSVVEIEMGLNASSSGTAARRVTNPSVAGSYFLSFSGTFGSGGSLVVPITASSGSGVSVSVPNPSGGGGGGGGGGGSTDGDDEDEADTTDDSADDPQNAQEDPGAEDTGDGGEEARDEEGGSEDSEEADAGSSADGTDSSTDGDGTSPLADGDSAGDDAQDEAVADSGGDAQSDLSYDVDVSAGEVVLPIVDDVVRVLPNTSPGIRIRIEDGDAASVLFEIGDNVYPLTEIADDVWQGDVHVDDVSLIGALILSDSSGAVVVESLTFEVISFGIVYEVVEDSSIAVEGALVTVLSLDGSVWDAPAHGQSASLITNASGSGFAWYVPNATYIVRVEKEGYATSETTVTATRGILAPTLFLTRAPDAVTPSSDGGVDVQEPAEAQVFTNGLVGSALVPVSAVSAISAFVAVMALGPGKFFLLLFSFFSQPSLYFARRSHQNIGVVYNSVTKVPLAFVTVRAFDVHTGRLVKTVVTNDRGEFILRVSREGTYRLQAVLQDFLFPSSYLRGVTQDGGYSDVYSGQPLVVSGDAHMLAVAIPLDPSGSPVSARTLSLQRFRRRLALAFSPLSVFLALGVYVFSPGIVTLCFFALQCVLYIFTWHLTHLRRKEHFGIVYDERTRHPVGNVVIRLFEPKYNKLVETLLSDARGRYMFALGPNEYYVTYTKDGYQETVVKPIDFRSQKEIAFFGPHIPFRRYTR